MNIETSLFIINGILTLAAAIAMVITRNMVYSALFMVVVFLATAVIYLVYQAPLIAMVQIAVYAGGIMVLFLFVIMLIGTEKMSLTENLPWQRPLAIGLGVAFMAEIAYVILTQIESYGPVSIAPDFGSPNTLGQVLFKDYLLPFEIISLLLLVALIGVVVLTVRERKSL